MIRNRLLHAALLFLALSVVLASPKALADTTISASVMPLTQLEQTGRVSGLASQAQGRKLFPPPVEALASAPYFQRDYRARWLSVSVYERTGLGERIGNQGRARFATERGWVKIVGSQARGIAQGPDAVVWDARTGNVRVLEAKGGSSQVTRTYGAWQGTNRNAIRSAEFVLNSNRASPLEKLAAARVIKAAQANRLETGVVKTSHVLGTPDAPRLEGGWSRENVAKEAADIERRVTRRNPATASTFRSAGKAQSSDMLRYRAAQSVTVLGLAGSGLLGWQAYQESRTSWEMWNDPVWGRSALPYLQTGFAGGRWAEAGTLALGSAAQLGWLGEGGLRAFGSAAGKGFLPLAVAVEGLSASITYYEYSAGRISQREFYRRSTGPAIFAVFTTGGAIIGGIVGVGASAPTLGTAAPGTVPAGAVVGASIGALVALPVQFVADGTWNWYYRKFDEKQRAAVDRAVERHYEQPSQ